MKDEVLLRHPEKRVGAIQKPVFSHVSRREERGILSVHRSRLTASCARRPTHTVSTDRPTYRRCWATGSDTLLIVADSR